MQRRQVQSVSRSAPLRAGRGSSLLRPREAGRRAAAAAPYNALPGRRRHLRLRQVVARPLGSDPLAPRRLMVKAGSSWRIAHAAPRRGSDRQPGRGTDAPGVLGSPASAGLNRRRCSKPRCGASALGLIEAVTQARIPPNDNVLVLVDQFEELFRFKQSGGRRRVRATRPSRSSSSCSKPPSERARLYVVLTMRSDFIGDCMEFPGLPEAINDGQYLVPRMTRDELRRGHHRPGRGRRRRDRAAPGHASAQRRRRRPGPAAGPAARADAHLGPLGRHQTPAGADRPRHYEGIGTMSDALSRHAEEASASWRPSASARSPSAFKALTDRRRTRAADSAAVRVAELAAIAGATTSEVVRRDRSSAGRADLPDAAGRRAAHARPIVDLSHESLMRCGAA